MNKVFALVLGLSTLTALLGGCHTASPKQNDNLVHVVLFKFPGGLPGRRVYEFYDDVSDVLDNSPSIEKWYVGTPTDVGGSSVDGNYDVAITATFAGKQALQDYLENPEHTAFVRKWNSLFEARVFDFIVGS